MEVSAAIGKYTPRIIEESLCCGSTSWNTAYSSWFPSFMWVLKPLIVIFYNASRLQKSKILTGRTDWWSVCNLYDPSYELALSSLIYLLDRLAQHLRLGGNSGKPEEGSVELSMKSAILLFKNIKRGRVFTLAVRYLVWKSNVLSSWHWTQHSCRCVHWAPSTHLNLSGCRCSIFRRPPFSNPSSVLTTGFR